MQTQSFYSVELEGREISDLINCIVTEKARIEGDMRRYPLDRVSKLDFERMERLHKKLNLAFEKAPVKVKEII